MKNHTNAEIIDLLIVGGGPAGMTAAIYGARAAMKTVVLEKEAPGGKMVKTHYVQNYPGYDSILGPDLAMKMYQQAMKTGAEFIFQEVVEVQKDKVKNQFVVHLANGKILKA
jgi:thioredoxin reductase (NADPH)